MAAAEQTDAAVPLSKLHENLLQSLVDAGMGVVDNGAIVKAFRRP
ncbi:hypothetical protein ACFL2H_11535 [Planctomycetota bacterium]